MHVLPEESLTLLLEDSSVMPLSILDLRIHFLEYSPCWGTHHLSRQSFSKLYSCISLTHRAIPVYRCKPRSSLNLRGCGKSRRREEGEHLMAVPWWASRGHACNGDD